VRDAFGRLVVDPDCLTLRELVDVVRRLSGELQAADGRELPWLGRGLARWLASGGDLAQVLGLRPARGSRLTATAIVAGDRRDRLLLRLSVAAGGDRAALRLLADATVCPRRLAALVAEVRAAGAPRSAAAFTRARQRVSRAGR
jgi:hypothetical protein